MFLECKKKSIRACRQTFKIWFQKLFCAENSHSEKDKYVQMREK